MSEEEVPLYPSEFVGWRGWAIVDGLLASVNSHEVWTPKTEFQAVCDKTHKHVPWTKCSCGLYATKTMEKLRINHYHDVGVFGQVSLWGHIVDGGEGYRSEFAYPRTIFVPFLSWRLVEALEVYGVPVRLLNPYTATSKGVE